MDPEKFTSELQAWMKESGAVKELRAKLRKEMYDMLMTKKLDNDQKNINILNDKRKNQESKSDLALNLLIVEHLMQRGLWCTASVMVSEADFLLEPPDIEVVTTAKKDSSKNGMKEYKRQSPAKLTEETIDAVSTEIFNFDHGDLMDSVCKEYYQTKESSVLCLMFKHMGEYLDAPSGKSYSDDLQHETSLSSKKDGLTKSSTTTNKSQFRHEMKSKSKLYKSGKSSYPAVNKDGATGNSSTLKLLQKQVIDARCDIESFQESKVRLSHLQGIIDSQNFCIQQMQKELKLLKSQQSYINEKIGEPSISTKRLPELKKKASVDKFVAHMRSAVNAVELEKSMIDRELAEMNI